MRMLLKISMPVEAGNAAIKSGLLPKTMQATAEALKPEAAYFYPEKGRRTGLFVFDMEDSSQLPAIVEPLFQNLDAAVLVTPVMNAEDLERGLKAAGVA